MHISDPSSSRAVLIGVHDYSHLEKLPAVELSLTHLAKLFRQERIWGLPDDCNLVLLQPTREQVFDVLHESIEEATDTFVLYFAGHGMPNPFTGELHLALADTSENRLDKAINYEDVRSLILRGFPGCPVRARRKIVILDCCWSGLATKGGMDVGDLGRGMDIEGTFVLTATAATRKALSPPGEAYTAFTGELISILDNGIPDKPELLRMSTVYEQLRLKLSARSYPEPQQCNVNTAGSICIFRNTGHVDPNSLPSSPEKIIENIHHKQGETFGSVRADASRTDLVDELEGLEREGATDLEGEVEQESAPSREVSDFIEQIDSQSPSKVAEYATQLDASNRGLEALQVADSAGMYKSVPEVLAAIEGLGDGEDRELTQHMLSSFSRVRTVADILDLIAGLRDSGRDWEAVEVIAGAASSRPAADVIELIAIFHNLGNSTDIQRVLGAAGRLASTGELIALMTALRGSGNVQSARLVLEAVVQSHAPERVGSVVKKLRKLNQISDVQAILESALSSYSADDLALLALVDPIGANWVAAQAGATRRASEVTDIAQVLTGQPLITLLVTAGCERPAEESIEIFSDLRGSGFQERSLHVLIGASRYRTPQGLQEIVDALRAVGLNDEALDVIDTVAAMRPAKEVDTLIKHFSRAQRTEDTSRLESARYGTPLDNELVKVVKAVEARDAQARDREKQVRKRRWLPGAK
ncbi:caspase family protein [Streptomyces platensis]|uniref:caspase family protein n=1 Tax=Streptomyces platensis TaxID=58346 RepID=UPI002E14D6DB|nr:caspase family protein [Streptomyces platensis]WSI55699.1 caspase family protein [Streptomyces platensis]